MAERVGVPGFLAGRRYVDRLRSVHQYFTLYEGADAGVFSSPAYLERLDNPTPWTRQTASYFRNFLRSACRSVAAAGGGTGGVMGTVQLEMTEASPSSNPHPGQRLVDNLVVETGIIRARIGVADAGISGIETEERRLRPKDAPPALDAVLLVDGLDRACVAAALADIPTRLGDLDVRLRAIATGVYDLNLTLEKSDIA